MDSNSDCFVLPSDPVEARKHLCGIVMVCDDGETWYDYDNENGPCTEGRLSQQNPQDNP